MPLPERATRKRLIDRALMEAGWLPIVPSGHAASGDRIVFEEYPTANGPADYALFQGGDPLAIVEALENIVFLFRLAMIGPPCALVPALTYSTTTTQPCANWAKRPDCWAASSPERCPAFVSRST